MKAIKVDGTYYELPEHWEYPFGRHIEEPELPEHWGKIRIPIQVADGYHYRSMEEMEDAVWEEVRAENIRDVLGMSSSAFSRVITDYVFDSLEKENKDMAAGAFNNEIEEKVFKVGDRVKHTIDKGTRGTITSISANVKQDSGTVLILNLNNLTHYDGPTSEEDAWERVTMDIAGYVSDRWCIDEGDRKHLRHEAYIVLGSVLKVDEEVKARVRGIIERAEKRFIDRN